jgi:hypothetical protein
VKTIKITAPMMPTKSQSKLICATKYFDSFRFARALWLP